MSESTSHDNASENTLNQKSEERKKIPKWIWFFVANIIGGTGNYVAIIAALIIYLWLCYEFFLWVILKFQISKKAPTISTPAAITVSPPAAITVSTPVIIDQKDAYQFERSMMEVYEPLKLFYILVTYGPKKKDSDAKIYTLANIDQMDGYKFEKCMGEIYEKLGYTVQHTPLSGDQGADLIITSKDRIRTAVQCKCYSNKVSNKAVQEVFTAINIHNCTRGIVVTNNYFTDSAIQSAQANGIHLVDRNKLQNLLNQIPGNELYSDSEWRNLVKKYTSLIVCNFGNKLGDAIINQRFDEADKLCEVYGDMVVNKGYCDSGLRKVSPRLQKAKEKYEKALMELFFAVRHVKAYVANIEKGEEEKAHLQYSDFRDHIPLIVKNLNEAIESINMVKTQIENRSVIPVTSSPFTSMIDDSCSYELDSKQT
jgi:restriction system protein